MAQDLRIKEGTFYLSSKEAKDGWERHEFPNPQNREETLVRYHKTLSVDGTIEGAQLKDDKYKGKVLNLYFKDKNEGDLYLNVPVLSQSGIVETTDSYFNSVVGPLENLNQGVEVKVFLNTKNKDKNDRLYKNIVILRPDNTLVKGNFAFTEVPRWTAKKKKDAFGEEKTEWDASKTNEFYINVMNRALENFKSEQPKPATPEQAFETAENVKQEELDDLPF